MSEPKFMLRALASNQNERSQTLGRYRLLTVLGQGGMGTIHLAIANGFGEFRKLLVVKELRLDLVSNEQFVAMFLQEAKLAARLNHPNVVQTLEVGNADERYFLSMEFLDGQPFIELLKRAAREPDLLPLELRLRVLCDALAGLHYAHEVRDYSGKQLHIVHRDVSPQNVFVTYHGQVKVVDFGIARAADANLADSATMFAGKFGYAAPEQLRGELIDRRADVFAAGVMLWELIALRRLASGEPTQDSLRSRILGTEPKIREVVPGVAPLLADICDRALLPDRSTRFQSAEELRLALEGFLQTLDTPADSNALGTWMEREFSAERAAMHRLIHASTLEAPSQSGTRRIDVATALPRLEDDTPVAEISAELVQISCPSNAPPAQATSSETRTPRRPARRSLAVAGTALAVVALGAFAYVHSGESDEVTNASDVASRLDVAAPSGTTSPPKLAATASSPEPARDPGNRASAARTSARQAPISHRVGKPKKEFAATNGASAAGRRPEVPMSPAPTAPQGEALAQPIPVASPAPQAGKSARMGEDLREAARVERRRVDVENPFR